MFVNTLRLTFDQELTDEQMENQLDTLLNELGIPLLAEVMTVSPIEQPDSETDNRHYHVHWVGEPLKIRTKERVMAHFRQNLGGRLYLGNRGSNYQNHETENLLEACRVLRYPLKTGVGKFTSPPHHFPEWFKFEEQVTLAALEYQARLAHERERAAREEAHKNSHGVNLYKLAQTRHLEKPFSNMNELLKYLVQTSLEDSTTVTISKSRIADIANKLSLEFQIVTIDEFVECILRKHF